MPLPKLKFPKPESMEHLEGIISVFTDYEKMEAFHSGAVRCDLVNMQRLVEALDMPHTRIPCVHVTGSKGKGSTVLLLGGLLESAGLRCGLFTSPHLVHLRERIALNGAPLADSLFLAAADRVLDALRRDPALRPTFFEFITATAMMAFREAAVDVVVYEVGLGGRLDATNVVVPEAAVITNVELEHVSRLGSTVELIAREKAGIIKPGVPVITALEKGNPARQVVADRASDLGSPLIAPGAGLRLHREGRDCRVEIENEEPVAFIAPRPAGLQASNCALALAVLHVLKQRGRPRFKKKPLPTVLSSTPLPGRFEVLAGAPRVIVDGAHSPASLQAVVREARAEAGKGRLVVLFGMARDKDLAACLAQVMPLADSAIFTAYESPRSLDPRQIRAAAGKGRVASSVRQGLALARESAGDDGVVLVTGSFYCAGEARAALGGR